MTPEERSWLSAVAAEASILQQNADFSKRIALEMLTGKNQEEAHAEASRKIWQEAAEKMSTIEVTPSQQEATGIDEAVSEDADEKRFQDLLEKAKNNDIIEFDNALEDIVASKSYEELLPLLQKLPNRATRKWYIAQNNLIPSQIDRSLDLEGQARQAFDLRNRNRIRARDLMLDQEARRKLDISEPNITFEEKVAYKMNKYTIDRAAALEDILRTATKTRKSVNEKLELE